MRAPAKSFTDLIVWQKAHAFVLQVYAATRAFPKEESYGLTAQLRRAAISIPANIAEGFRKQSEQDKARFLNISEGSLEECRYCPQPRPHGQEDALGAERGSRPLAQWLPHRHSSF